MLSNDGVDVWALFEPWVQFVVGERTEIVVALDRTEFDADDHATLAAYLITNHGRATPLVWSTVSKATLAGQRNASEYRVVERLHECLAPTVRITVLPDRGFGDQKLYRFLETLGWDYVIRFRGNIVVEDVTGSYRGHVTFITYRPRSCAPIQYSESPLQVIHCSKPPFVGLSAASRAGTGALKSTPVGKPSNRSLVL